MIERYSRPAMAALWTNQHKFEVWLQVELAAWRSAHPALDDTTLEEFRNAA